MMGEVGVEVVGGRGDKEGGIGERRGMGKGG